MKVKELIEILKELNPEAMVVRNGFEGGFCEVDNVDSCKVCLNVHPEDAWYYGPHEVISNGLPSTFGIDLDRYGKTEGVFIA